MRDSIAVAVSKDGEEVAVTAGNAEVTYAGFVENGTTYSAAQPFMRPAIESARKSLNRNLRKVI